MILLQLSAQCINGLDALEEIGIEQLESLEHLETIGKVDICADDQLCDRLQTRSKGDDATYYQSMH